MEGKIVYFEKAGSENTAETLRIAKGRADELKIKTLLVSSTSGETAVAALDALQGLRTVFVTTSAGFYDTNVQRFTEENRKIVEERGGTVLTTSHAFAGIGRALRNKTRTVSVVDIVASTLRVFGSGMKVACEISMMAADAGLVRTDEEVIALAGTHNGLDTAIVLNPVTSHTFFDLKVKEILCKPRF